MLISRSMKGISLIVSRSIFFSLRMSQHTLRIRPGIVKELARQRERERLDRASGLAAIRVRAGNKYTSNPSTAALTQQQHANSALSEAPAHAAAASAPPTHPAAAAAAPRSAMNMPALEAQSPSPAAPAPPAAQLNMRCYFRFLFYEQLLRECLCGIGLNNIFYF